MGILCSLGRHEPSPQMRSNGGATFSRCRDCGGDLILAASGWRPVPRGYRVVWRSAPPERAADPAQLALALPGPPGLPRGSFRIGRPAAAAEPRRRLRRGAVAAASAAPGRATA